MDMAAPNPLVQALAALDRIEATEKLPAEAADWQEARQAILRAMQERELFLAAVGAAVGLIDVLDDYNDVLEAGDEERVAELSEDSAEAEDALVEAINQVHAFLGPEEEASDDARLLEALDRFTSDDEEEPR